jgi:NAD(P)-dependent dehydrogenase (short-subunit alcohol dehydrogenase family)
MDQFRLDGKVSVVTGAAAGLGKAMARALGQAGSKVVIWDLNGPKAEETAALFREEGIEATAVQADVTKPDQIEAAVSEIMDRHGRIDALFNNAGITIHKNAEDMPLEDWHRVMEVNLNSVFMMSQVVGRIMIRQKAGSIVNTSSMSGLIVNTPQNQTSYNVSKAGVIMLTKSLAVEWARHNIRVNTIAPGYMKTEMTAPFFEAGGPMVEKWMSLTPMGRPGNPEELGGLAVYLASDASSFVTGGVFVIDGGYTAL